MNNDSGGDQHILSGCLSGDRKASERLVRQFSDIVYRSIQYTLLSKNVSFSKQDLEDLHNTVFLSLFEQKCKKLRQYQGKNGCSLTSWIRMITVRTVIDHLRKKGIDAMSWQKKRVTFEELPELKTDNSGFWAQIDTAEQDRALKDGMKSLPPRDRLFLKLHFEKGFSVDEVAETMQLSINNAYSVKHRAIQRLKSNVARITNSEL